MRRSERSFKELIADLPGLARPGEELSPAETAFANTVAHRPDAIGAVLMLLPYLEDSRRGVPKLAEFPLACIGKAAPRCLDVLIRAEQAGNGGLPTVIARIGSPRAIEFLTTELRRENEEESQIGAAFVLPGARGVPALCSTLRVWISSGSLVPAVWSTLPKMAR